MQISVPVVRYGFSCLVIFCFHQNSACLGFVMFYFSYHTGAIDLLFPRYQSAVSFGTKVEPGFLNGPKANLNIPKCHTFNWRGPINCPNPKSKMSQRSLCPLVHGHGLPKSINTSRCYTQILLGHLHVNNLHENWYSYLLHSTDGYTITLFTLGSLIQGHARHYLKFCKNVSISFLLWFSMCRIELWLIQKNRFSVNDV